MVVPFLALLLGQATTQMTADFHAWAMKPPMGWNSWDCFGTQITEQEYKDNVDAMADKLKKHGWQYAVVDIQWYEPNAKGFDYNPKAELTMDGNGRLLPAVNRFPSAKNGKGFKSLADYVHRKGLKFGVHLMRGIPRQAVDKNLPILGTKYHAAEIADKEHVCPWNSDMYGVDMTAKGAQEYYNSVFELLASWGVDFVKVDDLSRPYLQNEPEVEAIRTAIRKTKRKMVLSLSPGETDIAGATHVMLNANMWRISDDFWDSWPALREQFYRLVKWNQYMGPGHFPDADMLPLGTLANGTRTTNFTENEQKTLMGLWAIAKSPLILGADMRKLDEATLALLTNDELIHLNQDSTRNHPFYGKDNIFAWTATDPATKDTYVAVFNAQDAFDLSRAEILSEGAPITRETEGQGERIIANLDGFTSVGLAFSDSSDGLDFDHGIWVDPQIELGENQFLHLSKEPPVFSSVGYGRLSTTWAPGNAPLSVAGVPVEMGVFAHAPSLVVYDVPKGSTTFSAFAALNDSCMKAPKGATIQPFIFGFKKGGDQEKKSFSLRFDLSQIGVKGGEKVTDIWTGKSWTLDTQVADLDIPWHGCVLLRISH